MRGTQAPDTLILDTLLLDTLIPGRLLPGTLIPDTLAPKTTPRKRASPLAARRPPCSMTGSTVTSCSTCP